MTLAAFEQIVEDALAGIPAALDDYGLSLSADGMTLIYIFENEGGRARITGLLRQLGDAAITFRDLETSQSSLEEIFVSLVRGAA